MRENLSTTASITTTYAGESAGEYIQAALLANVTLGKGTITVKPNIKYKQVVKKLATSDLLANNTCDFTPTGTVTLTERIIEPKQLQVNLQLCKADFRSDWEAIQMGYSAFDTLPKNFSDFLIGNLSASVGASIESNIWQGTDTAGGFSGFTTYFTNDSDVVDVSGTGITSANVMVELGKVVEEVAKLNIYLAGEKPVIYVATNVMASYLIALGGFASGGLGAAGYKSEGPTGVQNAPLYYAGLQIVEAPGLPVSQMVAAQPSNLWFGTGLMNDENKVQVLDMADIDGSENVRFVMRFTAAVQYGIGTEIVWYHK